MGKPYSQDLRDKVLAAYDRHEVMMEELTDRFGVSVSFLKGLLRRRRETGSATAKPHAGGVEPQLSPEHLAWLEAEIATSPSATHAELRERLAARGAPLVSLASIGRAIKKL